MELVSKNKSSEEITSANELMLERFSNSKVFQNNSFSNLDIDLCNLQLLKQKYHSNPFTSYLNINSLSNKIDVLRQICKISPLEILCVEETKLGSSFPNFQIRINMHFHPYRRDRDYHGGGKMVFIRKDLITKILENLQTKLSETICLELTVSNKTGLYCLRIGLLKKLKNMCFSTS